MRYELVEPGHLRSVVGPNYYPFIADLDQIAQQSAGSLRVALVTIPLPDGGTLYGAALLDAETIDAIRTEAKAALE